MVSAELTRRVCQALMGFWETSFFQGVGCQSGQMLIPVDRECFEGPEIVNLPNCWVLALQPRCWPVLTCFWSNASQFCGWKLVPSVLILLKQSYSCELLPQPLPPPHPFSSLSWGEQEASGDWLFKCQAYSVLLGSSPGLFPGGFLLDLLSKREGILADTVPSESPLGSVDTLVFFPGSFTLALGSTSAQTAKHTQMFVRNTVDEGEARSQARVYPPS